MSFSESQLDRFESGDDTQVFRKEYGWGSNKTTVDMQNGQILVGGNKIGKKRNELRGDVLVENTDSVKSGLLGLPIRVQDNPSGLIPSTLFTPVPAFNMTVDPKLIELGILAIFAAIVVGAGAVSEVQEFDEELENG